MMAKIGERIQRAAIRLRSLPTAGAIVFAFSLFMTFVYMPYDVFGKPIFQEIADAREVWAGYMLRGVYAKLTEPIHWWIYGSFAYGFYHARRWVYAASAAYTVQVAVASGVWTVLYGTYGPVGNALAVVVSGLFLWLAAALWRARAAS